MGYRTSPWIGLLVVAVGCAPPPEPVTGELTPHPKPATEATRRLHAAAARSLPFDDTTDFELAARGRLDDAGPPVIPGDRTDGAIWDLAQYGFVDGDAPDTVHPSLWRQAKLNGKHGLYEVVDGIYQVRGYDLSNVTFVRGDTGWIVIDPLISVEAARAALALVDRTLGARPVVAVIYTHSHIDHFGGVAGVTTPEAVAAGTVRILAPEGFRQHALSENVLAGNVMRRRAGYMFGMALEPGPRGRVDTGLGKGVSTGWVSLIPPTDTIREPEERKIVDGVEIVFLNTPGGEAPAEMVFYFPRWRALCAAEQANAVLHNLYTLRGARVRSGRQWAHWLEVAIDRFGDDLEVVFGSHHWPRWGREAALEYLGKQRDLYHYIHDQTLRLANQGWGPGEIAERIALPEALAGEWYDRGYYGTVRHNARATYQLYLGWYDGHPAHLNPLPPEQAAGRYVEWMGGRDAVIERARAAFAEGEYRWVAEVMRHVVFADPGHAPARWLQADALEQLGYQAESGPWRNVYLSAAAELRGGIVEQPSIDEANADIVVGMRTSELLDLLSVRLDGPAAGDVDLTLELHFTDRDERWSVRVHRGVLRYREGRPLGEPAVTLRLARPDFVDLLRQQVSLPGLVARGRASLSGNPLALARFAGLFEELDPSFPIVTP